MRYIYLLKAGESHYKVGIAKNVSERVRTIQTSNPNPIEVVTARLVENEKEVEQKLHEYLADQKAPGGKEWFLLNDRQALCIATQISNVPEVNLTDRDLNKFLLSQSANQKSLEYKLDLIFDLLQKNSASRSNKQPVGIRP